MNNIALVGLMGAGKTTVGNCLAEKLNCFFVDTDSLIENKTKKVITEIFEIYGEKYFRELENKIAKELSDVDNTVISTGGGFIQNLENLRLLKNNAFVVYLKASEKVLFERIKSDTKRPLLYDFDPVKKLEKLLVERENNYLLANFVINTENKTVEEISDEIIKEYYANC